MNRRNWLKTIGAIGACLFPFVRTKRTLADVLDDGWHVAPPGVLYDWNDDFTSDPEGRCTYQPRKNHFVVIDGKRFSVDRIQWLVTGSYGGCVVYLDNPVQFKNGEIVRHRVYGDVEYAYRKLNPKVKL